MDILISFVEDQAWFNWVAAVVLAASAFAAATPTPAKGSWLSKVYWLIDLLAVNVGKAKDKAADAADGPPEDTPSE
tara:strand:- start:296 stop:523 length:228 start_codon:yes stop_codon:yes gene_type:complete